MTLVHSPSAHTHRDADKPVLVFERRVVFIPAFDLRRPAPSENYGIGAMRAIFYLIGPKGAVQWMIGLPFYVEGVRPEMSGWSDMLRDQGKPSGWDLGYHAREPQYDGQSPMGACAIIPDGPCYYDGSGLNADLLIEGFVNGGTDWLWPALEDYYRFTFDGGEWPSFAWSPRQHPADKARAAAETGSVGTSEASAPNPQPKTTGGAS